MAQQLADRTRRFFEEVWNDGNLAAIDAHAGPDYRVHMSMVGDVDRDGFKATVRLMRTAFPDLRIEIEDLLETENRIAVRWRARGTHRGELFGISPTGRKGEVAGITHTRYEGDKMVETWSVWDALAMLQQVGAAPELRMGKGRPAAQATPPVS